jgi:hypothetical protein
VATPPTGPTSTSGWSPRRTIHTRRRHRPRGTPGREFPSPRDEPTGTANGPAVGWPPMGSSTSTPMSRTGPDGQLLKTALRQHQAQIRNLRAQTRDHPLTNQQRGKDQPNTPA